MNATEPRKLAAGLCTGEALFRKARPRRLLRSALTVNAKGRYYIYLDVCACLLCSHNVRRDLGCHITGYIVKIDQLPAPRSSNARPTQQTPPNALPGIWLFLAWHERSLSPKTSRKPATFLFFRKCFLFLPCTGRIFGV